MTVCLHSISEVFTAIGTCALAITGVITVIYLKTQIKDFRREARVKHIVDLLKQFEQEPMAGYRRTLGTKRAPDGTLLPLDISNPPPELHDVMNFFEHMGYLLKGGYVSLEDVSVEFHYWILHVWADAKKVMAFERAENPLYYEHFAQMVQRLLEYDRPRTGNLEVPSESDVEDFYVEEAHLKSGSPVPRQRRTKRRA
jgi:hypothetical protein